MAEKWYLCLYDASIKLIHYFMAVTVEVVSPADVVKYMVSQPFIKGMLSKWSLHLLQFDLIYVPQKTVKGQALANFLATHPYCEFVTQESLMRISIHGSCSLMDLTPEKHQELEYIYIYISII